MNVFCGINFRDWQNLKSFAELMPQKLITLGYRKPFFKKIN